ncbi:DNA polymerase thumb domain-containing protein [Streptomyces sp. NPDC051569]|uniref:DNA polymerase Y family protein n=1 Tax=Streptomyces sp. NPDC051569 TaxID=3365661 RepID=UPI0037B04FBB
MRVLYVHSADRAGETWETLLRLLGDVTPVVEALPPDAVLADVGRSTRYFRRDAVEIAKLIRVRALALHGLECTIGVAANPLLARMAAADGTPGAVRFVADDPREVASFLESKRVAALPGVGPRTARTLSGYGLDSVGKVADAPAAVLQRILGAKKGRLIHERARGIDRESVVPNSPARSAGADHRFSRYELDGTERRRVLLGLSADIGWRLRDEEQVARALTLTVRYADGSTTTRTRALPEPTAHTPVLAALAYALHDALGLQRARVSALALRAEDLTAAESIGYQLTFDPQADKARLLEPVVDRIAARWPGVVGPAAVVGLTAPASADRAARPRPAGPAHRRAQDGRDVA